MQNKNALKIFNGEIEITMSTLKDKELTTQELISESVLMLLNSIDIKYFKEQGIYEKFFAYIKKFRQQIQAIVK